MAHTVLLPPQFTIQVLSPFVADVVQPDGTPVAGSVAFDFSRLAWIDGAGLTVFSNTLEWLTKHGTQWTFTNIDPSKDAVAYLDDCGFFKMYHGGQLRPGARVRPTTVPLTKVRHDQSFDWLQNRASPWLEGKLKVSSGALASIRASIKEVFNNIIDHSTEDIGCVHIQHYPQIKEIHITLSDFGCGIPNSIRAMYPGLDDGEAIKKATMEGVTSRSRQNNAGVGLNVLVHYVTGNGGTVSLYSLKGEVSCVRASDGGVARNSRVRPGSYPGTLVNIILREDLFKGDDIGPEDFQW